MPKPLAFLVGVSLSFSAGIAATTPPSDTMDLTVPPDFKVGFQGRAKADAITEFVRPPETVDNWTTLITTINFFGGGSVAVDSALTKFQDGLVHSCPGGSATPTVSGSVDGQAAAMFTFECTKNPQTGKPENVTIVAIKGSRNLLMTQVAFRHPRDAKDKALVEQVIGSIKMCDIGAMVACEARKATGFVALKR